jgi:hypothetical protein
MTTTAATTTITTTMTTITTATGSPARPDGDPPVMVPSARAPRVPLPIKTTNIDHYPSPAEVPQVSSDIIVM